MSKNYYDILGVSKGATDDEIKKAYRKLAHKYHPDKSGGDEAKFKEVNEAYQVLSDKAKRQQYDQFGQTFEGAGASGQGFGGFDFSGFQGFGEQSSQGFDFDFGESGFEDIFSGIFGGSSRTSRRRSRGRDIQVDMEIDFSGIKINSPDQFALLQQIVQIIKEKSISNLGMRRADILVEMDKLDKIYDGETSLDKAVGVLEE